MSARGRVLPALVAVATGVVSGVYIFQPLIIQERDKLIILNQSPTTDNNAPPNMASTSSQLELNSRSAGEASRPPTQKET